MLMTVRFGRCIGGENQRGENAKHQQDAFNHSSQHYRMICITEVPRVLIMPI